jgi:hypothetical protein
MKFDINDYSLMTIQADYSSQGKHNEIIGGALYGYKLGDNPESPELIIHGGAFVRWNDALIPVIKVEMGKTSFSVSYDANISLLKPSSYGRGGLELSLSWSGNNNNNRYRKDLLYPGF